MSSSMSPPQQIPKHLSNSCSSSSSSSSSWLRGYLKLRFFARIRRFVWSKAASKSSRGSDVSSTSENGGRANSVVSQKNEVIAMEATEDDSMMISLQRAVKKLHFGSSEEREIAAMEIERLAREDAKAKKLMAELGVVQRLVAMVGAESSYVSRRRAALRALIELANGNSTNKALMVEAGIFLALPKNIDKVDEDTRREFGDLLLSLSSLTNTHLLPLESSQIIPFTLSILESSSSLGTKESCLGTLYNLSTVLENASKLASHGAVNPLLSLSSSSNDLSEKGLATLANLVVTLPGKRALENSPTVPTSLIEVLTWQDKAKCQELSTLILMVLAHQSSAQRAKMAKLGIVPVLLEVALLGSALAQKRALKLLQWFKDERETRVGPHSGPQTGRVLMGSPVHYKGAQEGKKIMQRLVKESLHKNMEMITRRANAAPPSSSSGLKALVISTSSKSLPY